MFQATILKKQDKCIQLLYLRLDFHLLCTKSSQLFLIDFRSINKDQFEKKKNDTLDPEL